MIKQNSNYMNRILVTIDAILVFVALFFSWFIRIESGLMTVASSYLSYSEYMKPLYFLIPLYLFLYTLFELYSDIQKKGIFDQFIGIVKANIIGVLMFLSYLYVFRIVDYSRKVLIIFFVISISLTLLERYIFRVIIVTRSHHNQKNILILGYSDLAIEYSKRIHLNEHWGYNIVGLFDDHLKRDYISLHKETVKVLGDFRGIDKYIENNHVDEIIITIPLSDYHLLEEIVTVCEKQGIYTRIIPDYYKVIPARPYIEDLDGLPIISIRKIPLNDWTKKTVKRLIDVFAALIGSVLLSPMFLLIAIIIKSQSKGPVIFKQVRVGLNRKEFQMYKFRSMIVQDDNKEKKAWTTKNDPRVTKFGAFLRKTSLDEFPQLFNVLRGDMSLVGPRPERPQFVDRYKEEIPKYMVKHQVRPGMTGWAQIHGLRGDTSIEDRIEYDLYYIENWSLNMELRILILTFIKGFINKNAY